MASNNTLSDNGLVWGTLYSVTVDGYSYLLKTADHEKPVDHKQEFGSTGLFSASASRQLPQKISGTIMAYAGTPDPSQLVAFSFLSKLWQVGTLKLAQSSEGIRSYSVEINQLASTSTSTVTYT